MFCSLAVFLEMLREVKHPITVTLRNGGRGGGKTMKGRETGIVPGGKGGD
jgi:hypothetical protein